MKRGLLSIFVGAWTWLGSSVALACPVCFSATDANRNAFLGTTVVLSLLPLAMLAGVILWVRAAARDRAAEEAERIAAQPDPSPGE